MEHFVVERLKNAMERDKLYLDPKLNLKGLARRIGVHSKMISTVLSKEMATSFNRFINTYRIKTIEEELIRSHNKKFTIAGVAFECGFNSQPTFQRVFKSVKGESPTEYLRKRANKQTGEQIRNE